MADGGEDELTFNVAKQARRDRASKRMLATPLRAHKPKGARAAK
jgi:hypothetical protein